MSSHEEIRERLPAAALDELDEAQRKEIETHVQTCGDCRDELKRIRAVLAAAERIRDAKLDDEACREAGESVLKIVADLEARRQKQHSWLKYAAAAVLIAGVWLILQHFMGAQKFPTAPPASENKTARQTRQNGSQTRLESEKRLAQKLFESNDIPGLAALYRIGEPPTKQAVIDYLRTIGTDETLRTIAELERQETQDTSPADGQEGSNQQESAPVEEPQSVLPADSPVAADAGTALKETPLEEQVFYEADAVDADNWQTGILGLKVMDAVTGEPVRGAALEFRGQLGKLLPKDAKTNQFGRFEAKHYLPEVEYADIRVRKAPYASVDLRWNNGPLPLQYELKMKKAVTVGGTVRTTDGAPVNGASIDISMYIQNNTHETYLVDDKGLTTDQDGKWRIDGFPPDIDPESFGIKVEHPDYVMVERYSISPSVESLTQQSFVIEMRQGLSVRGHVLDEAGRPIEGAVIMTGSSRYDSGKRETKTDAEGRYEFANCHPSELVLTVTAGGFAPDLREVKVSDKLENVNFSLAAGCKATVRVVDPRGFGIGGAEIRADEWRSYSSSSQRARTLGFSAKTDAAGVASLADLPADEVRCAVMCKGYAMYNGFAIAAGEQGEYEIVMLPEGKLTGRVIDAQTGLTVTDFYVIEGIQWLGQEKPTWQRQRRKHGENGMYEQKLYYQDLGLAVRIEADGYLPAEGHVYMNEGRTITEDIVLYRGRGPSGTVTLADAAPVAGAEVSLTNSQQTVQIENGRLRGRDMGVPAVKTDENGAFQLGVADSPWRLVALHEAGYAIATEEEFAQTGTLTLQPWGSVEGVVYVNNKPAPQQTIRMHPSYADGAGHVGNTTEAVTDENGRFSCDRVFCGRLQVSRSVKAEDSSRYVNTTFVQVEPGQTAFVELGKGGRNVVGRLVLPKEMQGDSYGHVDVSVRANVKPDYEDMPDIQIPERYFLMTDAERQQWQQELMQSPAFREYMKKTEEKKKSSAFEFHGAALVLSDGTVKIDNIPPGSYLLGGSVGRPGISRHSVEWYENRIGQIKVEFTVPEITDEKDYDRPVDIGEVTAEPLRSLAVGQAAPALELSDIEGQTLSLRDLAGRYVLIDFGGLGSPNYSEQTLPVLQEAFQTYKEAGRLVILTITTSYGPYSDTMMEALRYFAREKGVGWRVALIPVAPDQTSDLEQYMEGGSYPSLLLLAPDGTVAAVKIKPEELQETLRTDLPPPRVTEP